LSVNQSEMYPISVEVVKKWNERIVVAERKKGGLWETRERGSTGCAVETPWTIAAKTVLAQRFDVAFLDQDIAGESGEVESSFSRGLDLRLEASRREDDRDGCEVGLFFSGKDDEKLGDPFVYQLVDLSNASLSIPLHI
jgi:hypothetical protein